MLVRCIQYLLKKMKRLDQYWAFKLDLIFRSNNTDYDGIRFR